MPSLGADMTEGVLLEWLVHPGQHVRKGDIVAVVDTSKAAVEVECFETGVVESLLISEGTRVPVGTPLATIATGAPPASGGGEPAPAAAAGPGMSGRGGPAGQPVLPGHPVTSPLVRRLAEGYHVDTGKLAGTGVGGRVTRADVERAHEAGAAPSTRPRISPLARKVAAELGIDPSGVTGTGPGGAIGADDIRRAAPAAPVRPRPVARADGAAAMRATIAAAMARAKREIPHYYLTHSIDMAAALAWLRRRNAERPAAQRVLAAAMLAKAAARAAAAVPALNGFWRDGDYVPASEVHLGIAVSLRGGGLVAPAIHRADQLDLGALMAAIQDLVVRARAGRLRGSELSDGTITVSSLGDQGVESIMGIIYPPQVALIGFGAIVERPWAVNGLLGVRPVVVASVSGDHRATDGATGARYLRTVEHLLQTPEEL